MGISQFLDGLEGYQDIPAVIYEDRILSYEQLVVKQNYWLDILSSHEIPSGACVAYMGEFSEHMVALTIALMRNNNILVPIITEAGKSYEEQLQVADVQFVILFDSPEHYRITTRKELKHPPLLKKLRDYGEPGLILFTSGSTGKFKALVHRLPKLIQSMQSRKKKPFKTLVFLLLDHIGGFNTLLNVLVNGGTAVFSRDRSAKTVCRLIDKYQIQLLPTTPTFINMLLISGLYKSYELSSLELITYGTEPMPDETLKAMHKVLPDVYLKQTYGLTETGIIPTKSESNESLWLKVGGQSVETKIVNGRLWVRTDSAMLGYLNAPSPFDDEGWLDTGDMVEEKDGFIRILGENQKSSMWGVRRFIP